MEITGWTLHCPSVEKALFAEALLDPSSPPKEVQVGSFAVRILFADFLVRAGFEPDQLVP